MLKTAGLLAAATVLLAGCSGDGDSGGGGGGATGEPTGEQGSGPLAGLTPDALCATVDHATIERQFNEPVADELSGVNPPEQRGSVVCEYLSKSFVESDTLDGGLVVTVKVTPARDAPTPQEALDAYMIGGPEHETVDYQRVDGLGEIAGYAGSELDVGPAGSHLAVLIDIDGELIEVVTRAEPEGTLEALRPIAEQLVDGVLAELDHG